MSDNDDYQRGNDYPAPAARGRSQSPGARQGGGGGGGDNYYQNGNDRDVNMRPVDDRERQPAPREERPSRGDDGAINPGNNLHVSGLSLKVEARDLEDLFTTVGKVQKASIMYDPHTRDSRGFGFVMMDSPEDAVRAIETLDKKELMGKLINVQHAKRARARTPTPGRYFGPPKPEGSFGGGRGGGGGGYDRPYQPRSYDPRYDYPSRGGYYDDRYDRRGGGGGGGYDDRRDYGRYDDRDRRGGPPGGYDDRPPRPRYDERGPPPPPRGGGGGGGEYGGRSGGGGGGGDRYDDRPARY